MFSKALTKTRVFWSRRTDSHTDIIAEHGLHEDGAHGVNVVKVEISPEDGRLDSDPDTWRYKLDQDRTPDWYDPGECERRARRALTDWLAKRVFKTGEHEIEVGQVWLYDNASATLSGNASATLRGNASALMFGNASVSLYDNASARLFGNASAVLYGNASARLLGNASAVLYGNASARLLGKASAVLYGNASARLLGTASARLYGNASCESCEQHSTVRHYSSAEPVVPIGPYAVVLDCRGASAVPILAEGVAV